MRISNAVRMWCLVILSVCGSSALADKDLDAELEAEWGSNRVKTRTLETPKSRYEARLKLIEATRDSQIARCKSRAGGTRYCANYAEEQFRRDLRTLEQQFEGQIEDMPRPRVKRKGIGAS